MVKGALLVKSQSNSMKNHALSSENGANDYNKGKGKRKSYPPYKQCRKMSHPPFRCWRRPNAKCRKCNDMGHKYVICRYKF